MRKTAAERISAWIGRPTTQLSEAEARIIRSALEQRALSRDTNVDYAQASTFGERLADGIARVGGSWSFIIGFLLFLVVWTILNTVLLGRDIFDPYPFVFLNLVLSMVAALQAPVIMMSQNRQAARDRIDAAHDYEVNLKAEIEIMALHEKLDDLRQMEIIALRQKVDTLCAQIERLDQRLGDART